MLAINIFTGYVINVHHNRHEHGIEYPCKCGSRSGIPDPVSGCKIPDKKSRISVKENAEFTELFSVLCNVLFNKKQWDKSRK